MISLRDTIAPNLVEPNARLQLLPEARATQERRLEAVSCKALLGPGLRPALARHASYPWTYGEMVPDTFAFSRRQKCVR